MERTLKIFISCALGAGVGTMVALEVYHYFWWIGLLAGGVVGYLSYEFKEVLAVIRIAWHAVIGFRPDRQKVVKGFLGTIVSLSVGTSFLSLIWIALVPIEKLLSAEASLAFSFTVVPIWLTVALSATLFMKIEGQGIECGSSKALKKMILFVNPIMMFTYWPVWFLWKIVQGLVKYGPLVPPVLWKGLSNIVLFVKTVFILIHSEIRLLCGIDAAIGATIGYFAGSVLIGAVVGGIIGVLNYKVISVRVLHLVPGKSM